MDKIFRNIQYLLKKNYRFFTTPGHKQGEAYKGLNVDFENLLKYDLTEVPRLDNLHNPEGCIENSLENLRDFYESKRSYYLVNGSTSGVHIMIFSLFNEKDEILIERGCHKSIMDAIYLRKLKVNYINREKYTIDLLLPEKFSQVNYNEKNIILNRIKESVENNPKIKGVVLTNPNYYGMYIEQKEIYEYLESKGIYLLIDSAHGAHIRAFNKEINCTNKHCHISVMSAHKTLGAFTQGAYLHVNHEKFIKKINEYFSIFTTTSPSYLIMISLEKSLKDCIYEKEKGNELINNCLDLREFLSNNSFLESITNCSTLNKTKGNFKFDNTRICLKFNINNSTGEELYNYLYNEKIICEMSFFNGVVLIPSIYTKKSDFEYLKEKLKRFPMTFENNNMYQCILNSCNISYEKIFDPYELEDKKYRLIKIEESFGKVIFNNIFLYPPGTPLVFKGEKILKEHIDLILEYKKLGYNIKGIINNQYLKVVEE